MKAYWDSSAILEAFDDLDLRLRLRAERGITRTHTLAEVFSTLTGKLPVRLDADRAAEVVEQFAADLDFVDLTPQETLAAFKQARQRGVRGGRVHDFLHAIAAKKSGATQLLTADKNDFDLLVDKLKIEQV